MTDNYTTLTEDEFDERYPLIRNHLNPSAGWAFGDEAGCLFETYDDELDFVRRQDSREVWTLVDGDDGELYVVSGLHYVNRIGYLVSAAPLPPGVNVEVRIDFAGERMRLLPDGTAQCRDAITKATTEGENP